MPYSKYFKHGQKLFLKRIFVDEPRNALDSMTAYVTSCGASCLDVSLPYGSDAAAVYPFEEGMLFELSTDFNGMGLRLRASFLSRTGSKDIRLQFEKTLEFVSCRIYRRVDVNAWVGIEQPADDLADMRRAWQDNLRKIETGISAAELTVFKKYLVNLAGGGLRLPLTQQLALADLRLLFLSIGDKQGIICALAEVVWIGQEEVAGVFPTGLRFVNIKERDQTRIDAVVDRLIEHIEKR